ncbi:MAG TPA: Nramp family divalent metal transporter [Candidatus Babeliaceae bacterium]|nr:Nramp family divalent metal transporter [Candidatus Babeliaceae bacterium]
MVKYINYLKKFLSFAGPGYLVAVGYMDPGNWATGLAGGSRFGYTLLFVVLASNFIALLLQYCALKLGIVSGKDLARACRDYYSPATAKVLWVLAEVAVIATDLAEVIGSAIGLQLLFGIPLLWGIALTVCDVLLLLFFTQTRARSVQVLITVLIAVIMSCFSIIVYLVKPIWSQVTIGFLPSVNIFKDFDLLYLAIGILGATVMPHNLYLHSALVTPRPHNQRKKAIFYSSLDLGIALTFAFFVNAAIIIVAAALFYKNGLYHVEEIQQAYYLFTPLLHTDIASFVFAIALLISGQNSTVTGTLTGQIIIEGFMNFSMPAWLRRLIGRLITIIPAFISVYIFGECCVSSLMILSQVILSLQLPFAIFPLLEFTCNRNIMGEFANGRILKACAYASACIIVTMNLLLILFLVKNFF